MNLTIVAALLCLLPLSAAAADTPAASTSPSAADTALARQLGADERGMRNYVLVILKTGPTRVPAGPDRDAMFKGHFANMKRLADEGKLVFAGPFTEKSDWRGLYLFAVDGADEARKLVATDPVIQKGEMVAEVHPVYATAALAAVYGIHQRIAPPEQP